MQHNDMKYAAYYQKSIVCMQHTIDISEKDSMRMTAPLVCILVTCAHNCSANISAILCNLKQIRP